MAWVRCRREGLPAKLVLETDGSHEEVHLWFRRAVTRGEPAAAADNRQQQSGKRRRERARRTRRREERRRGERDAPTTPVNGVPAAEIPPPPLQPTPSSVNTSTPLNNTKHHTPPTKPATRKSRAALVATRASKRAAVLAKRRGTARHSISPPDVPTEAGTLLDPPEVLREPDGEQVLNITPECSSPPPPPSPSLSPPSPPPPPSYPLPPSPQSSSTPSSEPSTSPPSPPPPPPMSSRFPRFYRRVICQECFYYDHDYSYYHCMNCHTNGPPSENVKLANIKNYAIS